MRTASSALKRFPREAGKRPSIQQLRAVVDRGLAREGTKNQVALAMALRPTGTTQPQIIAVLGQPHRNKFKQVRDSKKARVVLSKDDAGHTVYRMKL